MTLPPGVTRGLAHRPRVLRLPLSMIHRDPRLQMRAGLDPEIVAEYRDKMLAGEQFPPAGVIHDGEKHWLWDGNYRCAAAEAAGSDSLQVEVSEGTFAKAIELAAGANDSHGVRRTNADKRRSVQALLSLPNYAGAADRELAKICRVSAPLVALVRQPERQVSSRDVTAPVGTPRTASNARNLVSLSPATEKLLTVEIGCPGETPMVYEGCRLVLKKAGVLRFEIEPYSPF